MTTEEVPQDEQQTAAKFELKFEASGVVGKGEGPDALDVPEQPDQEEDES